MFEEEYLIEISEIIIVVTPNIKSQSLYLKLGKKAGVNAHA